jgi:hypothetical protein
MMLDKDQTIENIKLAFEIIAGHSKKDNLSI